MESPLISTAPNESAPKSSKPSRKLHLRLRPERRDKHAEALARHGVTAEQVKGLRQITPILSRVDGGIKACVDVIRGDPRATSFIEKWDGMSATDRTLLSVEEICVIAGITPKHLIELVTGNMIEQSDDASMLMVAAAKPAIVGRMIKEAKTALGEADRENFLRGRQVDWFVPPKGLNINLDQRQQHNFLGTGEDQRGLPPPKADAFLLELSSTVRGDHMLEAPEPEVAATIPEAALDVEFEDAEI